MHAVSQLRSNVFLDFLALLPRSAQTGVLLDEVSEFIGTTLMKTFPFGGFWPIRVHPPQNRLQLQWKSRPVGNSGGFFVSGGRDTRPCVSGKLLEGCRPLHRAVVFRTTVKAPRAWHPPGFGPRSRREIRRRAGRSSLPKPKESTGTPLGFRLENGDLPSLPRSQVALGERACPGNCVALNVSHESQRPTQPLCRDSIVSA